MSNVITIPWPVFVLMFFGDLGLLGVIGAWILAHYRIERRKP